MAATGDVHQHLATHLGGPGQRVLSRDGVHVYRWAVPDDPDVEMLATVGASSSSERRGIELALYSRADDVPPLAELLADLSAYPSREGTFLHWFHALPLGRPIVPNSGLTALYLAFPPVLGADFATLRLPGARVDIVWVIPITAAERDVFASRGADALEEALEEAAVDLADLRRASVR